MCEKNYLSGMGLLLPLYKYVYIYICVCDLVFGDIVVSEENQMENKVGMKWKPCFYRGVWSRF